MEKEELMISQRGIEMISFRSLRRKTGILLGPTDFLFLNNEMVVLTSSAVTGVRKKQFLNCLLNIERSRYYF